MPEKESTSTTSSSSNSVDLNSLADLSFAPSWADGKNSEENNRKEFRDHNKLVNNRSGGKAKKDRRGQTKFRNDKSASSYSRNRNYSEQPRTDFVPKFDVKIYPQDETFEALVKQLKTNFRTYQLFEITRLILEKSDRFVCLINRITKDVSESVEPIYFTPEDNLPFDTEEEAINHYCEHYLNSFFDIQTVEVEPPKGNFTLVYRCPFTKELIGPPNFHRFPELLKAHHYAKIKNLSLEDYQNKLEALSDEAAVAEWLESTKQQKHYRVKKDDTNSNTEEIVEFKTVEEARRYLTTNHKDKIVRPSTNFRFSGAKLDSLSKGNLKQSILESIDAQRRFPLDTANNIRGRLRRHKFTIYKKGSKGISYVCCVKRKFRDDSTVFTDSINELIAFIEKNQNIRIQDLPYKFLSISKPNTPKVSPSENKGINPEQSSEVSKSDASATETDNQSKEEANKITEVIRNVRWLIIEGYVTEYSDGKLFVHPKAEVSNPSKSVVKASSANNKDSSKEATETQTVAESSTETSESTNKVEVVSEEANQEAKSKETLEPSSSEASENSAKISAEEEKSESEAEVEPSES